MSFILVPQNISRRKAGFGVEGDALSDCGTTYTQNGIEYRSCTFTETGSFTVAGDGYIDVMVVAGGGGAGSHSDSGDGGIFGGGGGAGGMLVETNVFVTAGTYDVEVGGGGPGSQGTNGQGEASSVIADTGSMSTLESKSVCLIVLSPPDTS